MNHEIKEPIGSLRISKDVLATIAANATKEIEELDHQEAVGCAGTGIHLAA